MPYFIPKFYKHLPQFCHVNSVFSSEEVDKIIDLEDLQRFTQGYVGAGGDGVVSKEARNSDVCWINHDESSDWLFGKFAQLTAQVNQDHFLYDIEFLESFQYTVYRGDDNQHYNWHLDSFDSYTPTERKISASIMLSDPDTYEGGELDIIINGVVNKPVTLKPQKGDVVFFASWMPHRVRPVTSGVRKSLVAWVMGKRASL